MVARRCPYWNRLALAGLDWFPAVRDRYWRGAGLRPSETAGSAADLRALGMAIGGGERDVSEPRVGRFFLVQSLLQ